MLIRIVVVAMVLWDLGQAESFSRPFLFLDSVEKQINSLADVPLTMILHLVVLKGNGRLRTK